MTEPLEPESARERDARLEQAKLALRLRPDPPRVTRLSRKVLTAIGSLAALAIGSALIYALQTSRHDTREELYSTDTRAAAEGLSVLPRDYGAVARLGPALPADLGRAILHAGQQASVPPIGPGEGEQHRLQEEEAARTARLFTTIESRNASASSNDSPQTPVPRADLAGLGLAPQTSTPTAQERQLAFVNQSADKRSVSPDRVSAPASPYSLQAGSVIPAALITGIRSDLPGQITAQVTGNVHDSPTGRLLLIPQGTRLIGQYDNGIGFGQRRVLLVWNRLIFPNGRSIALERQPGADTQGYAGLEDEVDYHWSELFRGAMLSTILSVGAQAGIGANENGLVQALRSGASNGISQTGQQIVQRQLNIQPTLTIRPGYPVRVIVTHDLVLEPYGGEP
ncbi:MAG: TrbI/VirB10 family protein [Alphaproteobacteria bacterium]|nr:TrbI/VirB10 family protein [Alphaproteobacteria bacterium]